MTVTNTAAQEVVTVLLEAGLIALKGSSAAAAQSRKRHRRTTLCEAAGIVREALNKVLMDGPAGPRCTTCGEVIKDGMVRLVEAGGMRHIPGALGCRKSLST